MGKVTLFEFALQRMLESADGDVGREIERRAEKVVAIAREEVAAVLWRYPSFAENVDYRMEDNGQAVIGFLDQGPPDPRGPTFNYLANKEIREGRFLEHALWIGHEG